RSEDDVEADSVPRTGDPPAVRGGRLSRLLGEVDYQRVPDAEHGVLAEVFAAAYEDVRDEPAIPGRVDHEVQVGGTHRSTTSGLQQLADRSIVGDWIGHRAHAPKGISALLVAEQVCPPRGAVVVVLHVVIAVSVGFPDLN